MISAFLALANASGQHKAITSISEELIAKRKTHHIKIFSRSIMAASFALLASSNAVAQTNSAYFTEPALEQNKLVFASQGDLWLSSVESTLPAKRLTSHTNIESNPHISPDGSKLAFVSNYDDISQVYVMPLDGGLPTQLSFELRAAELQGWIDNENLLYSTSSQTGMHSSSVLKRVNVNDFSTTELPVSDAKQGLIADNTLYFVQFGLQVSTDNANHYKGGAKGELWSFHLNNDDEATQLSSNHSGSVSSPMLYQGRLFFVSNESGLDNIWSMELNGSDIRQHTTFSDWAVRSPYLNKGKIVFQHGADIKQLSLANNQVSTFELSLQSDNPGLRTQYIDEPLEYLNSASISHDGGKVLLTARGQMAVANTNVNRLVNVASDATSRSRHGVLSHDGKSIYAVSDVSGEYEIWQFNASGKTDAKQLTDDGNIFRTGLWLSPNGKLLANADKSGKLFLLNIDSGKNTLIAKDLSMNSVADVRFSADSQFLSFTYTARNSERSQIFLLDIDSGKNALLTTNKYESFNPEFSSDSQWLYFLSNRAFNASPGSPWGDRNLGQVFDDRTQLFAIALNKDAKFPFAAPSELDIKADDDDKKQSEEEQETQTAVIDWDGIEQRLWQVDIPNGNYSELFSTDTHLFLLNNKQGGSELHAIEQVFQSKLESVTAGVSEVMQSADKKQLLVQKGQGQSTQFFVVPAEPKFPSNTDKHSVKLSNWTLAISPKQEWQQIFKDAWLMHRDSLFDQNMRGLDWTATKQKYMPLVARVGSRDELNDVFKQMMGELNALHSQVRGGDIASDDNTASPATLGGVFANTKDGLRLEHIYQFDKEQLEQAPPLARPGLNVESGDLITTIDGLDVSNTAQLYQALLNKAGQQVLLDIKRGRKEHQVIVVPEMHWNEVRYRYQDWSVKNLDKVKQAAPDMGYLHLYAMGANDIANFAREFYAQYKKPGLIIDVRRNRGGNIDSVIIEKLLRRAWSFWQNPDGESYTNMQQSFRGHLVVLADEFTYSDGETFTAGIKALDLGTVIGKQTAGAGVWLSGGNRVVDRGIARVAEFPVFAMDGRWITEGRGISPDIEVNNLPHATYNGDDAQLDAAINYLREKLENQPISDYKSLPLPSVEESAQDIN